jgi:hypothetical protein
MLHVQLAALALATTALAAAGCGSTSKQSSTDGSVGGSTTTMTATATSSKPITPQPLTRAKLIAQANVICRQVNARRAKMRIMEIKTPQDYARFVPPFASYQQAMFAKLDKLIPPASMAKDWIQILAQAKTLADDMTRIGEYAKANEIGEVDGMLPPSTKAQEQMIVTAKRDGFKDCARLT